MQRKTIFILFILLELLIVVITVYLSGFTLQALQTITRFSGRLSLVLFSLIFLLKHRPDEGVSWISDRPYLLFAMVHGIHLIELLSYVTLSGAKLIPIRLLGGFVAYVLIFAMPWLSARHAAGKTTTVFFSRAEMIFHYYVWFIFFMSYLPRVLGTLPGAGGTFAEHVTLFVWVLLMLSIRLTIYFRLKPAHIHR